MFPFGTLEDIALAYKANICPSRRVTGLNAPGKEIELDDGTKKRYDKIPVSYTHLDVYKRQKQ